MSNDNYSHSLSLPTNPASLINSRAPDSPSDSPEFFTPCGTPEPRFKFPQKEADGARARPSNLSLPDGLPSIVKQEATPVAPDVEPSGQYPSAPLPALHRCHSADGRNQLELEMFPKLRRLSATPETSRKLAHPSENPFSKSPSVSCENIKTNSLTRRAANPLTRHETKETSHVDVCDSEDEYQVNQYIIKEDIGKGAYGQVKKVFDKQTKQMKAMKIISKKLLRRKAFQRRGFSKGSRSLSSQDEDKGIRKEIAVQKKLDHPCIVRLFEVLDDENKNEMYLVLEYLERGPVMELGRDGPISEDRCRPYFVDMLLGVEYLHFQNIIHRDIKPENLLLDDHGRLKIADFGESEDVSGLHHGDQSVHKNVGTPAFYAPELTDPSAHVTKAVDVWAMGVTLYCMLFAVLPFKGDSRPEIFSAIQSQALEFPKRMVTSSDIRGLLALMLDKSPESRVDLDGIRSHQWVDRAGYLVSKQDNCSQYIEVTDEEVNDAIRDCTTHFAALVLVKMMLQKKSFKVPAFNRMMQRAATVQEDDKPDTEELRKPRSASVRDTSDTDLSNQFSDIAITLPVPERHKLAKSKNLVHQNSVHSSTGDPSPSTPI